MKTTQKNHTELTLLQPYFSEKSTLISEKKGGYVFKTSGTATKSDIKNTVETYFNVPVESVRVCKVQGRKVNFKQREGKRSSWKKAYVTLKSGHNIDFTKDVKVKL